MTDGREGGKSSAELGRYGEKWGRGRSVLQNYEEREVKLEVQRMGKGV